tara:strand:+ start:1996 stop:5814 length:3819 start_codon:yes stop_codon:yes gene_type:complete
MKNETARSVVSVVNATPSSSKRIGLVVLAALIVVALLAAAYFAYRRYYYSPTDAKEVGAESKTDQIDTCDTFDCGADTLTRREPYFQDGNTAELCCRKKRCSDKDASGERLVDCAALGLVENLTVEYGATPEACCVKNTGGPTTPFCSAFDCEAQGQQYKSKSGSGNVGNSRAECCQLKKCSAINCDKFGTQAMRRKDDQEFGFTVEMCCERNIAMHPLNGIVTGMTPFASSAGDAARPASSNKPIVFLNKASEKSVDVCARFCNILEPGLLANLAPVSRKALDSCQCYHPSPKATFDVLVGIGQSVRGKILYAGSAKINRNMCAVKSASPECDPGTASLDDKKRPQCHTAEKTGDGFHRYRSTLPLLETPVYVWFDDATKTARYMRVTNHADTGPIHFGFPSAMTLKATSPLFKNRETVFADMRLGIVFKNGRRPAEFSTATSASAAGAIGKTKFGEYWFHTPSLLQCGIIRRKSDGKLAQRLTHFTTGDVLAIALGTTNAPDSGKLTEQADETITFVYKGVAYKFANRAYGADDQQEYPLHPVYPKVDVAPSPKDGPGDALTRFDYSHFLISKMDWLRMPLSIGKMSPSGVFTPSTAERSVVLFLVRNDATPYNCLSCKARQHAACDATSILIGCGFNSPGHCGSCYMPALAKGGDDQPCGNCQIGRLHVKTEVKGAVKTWTDATLNILRHAHRHDAKFDVGKAYFGPFLSGGVLSTSKNQKAGLFSIEHAMKNASMRKRMALTAQFTGSASNSKVGFCVLANNNSYTSVSPSERSEKEMTMHVNQHRVGEWIEAGLRDRLNGFNFASTLNGLGYGPSVCQYGSVYPNGFDGGFCTLAFGDTRLFSENNEGMRYADMSSNAKGVKEMFSFKRIIHGFNKKKAAEDITKAMLAAFGANGADSNPEFMPCVVWTLQPRVLFPRGMTLPVYNIYQGAKFPTMDRTVRIYNDLQFKDDAASKATSASDFNNASRSRHFDATETAEPAFLSTFKVFGMKIPPVTSVHVQGGGGKCKEYVNTSVKSALVELTYDFATGANIVHVGRANIDESEEDLGKCWSDKPDQRDDKLKNVFSYKFIERGIVRPQSGANDEDYIKATSGIKVQSLRWVHGKTGFTNLLKFIHGSWEDQGWYLVPRIAAECRVQGYGYVHGMSGETLAKYLNKFDGSGSSLKRFKNNFMKKHPNFIGYGTNSKENSGEFRFDSNRAEYQALYLPFFKAASNWGLGEGVMARCAKKVRERDLRIWTIDHSVLKNEESKGSHTFEERVPSTSWTAE